MGSKLNHPNHNLTTRSVSAKEASLIHSASPKNPFIMPQCTEKKKIWWITQSASGVIQIAANHS